MAAGFKPGSFERFNCFRKINGIARVEFGRRQNRWSAREHIADFGWEKSGKSGDASGRRRILHGFGGRYFKQTFDSLGGQPAIGQSVDRWWEPLGGSFGISGGFARTQRRFERI